MITSTSWIYNIIWVRKVHHSKLELCYEGNCDFRSSLLPSLEDMYQNTKSKENCNNRKWGQVSIDHSISRWWIIRIASAMFSILFHLPTKHIIESFIKMWCSPITTKSEQSRYVKHISLPAKLIGSRSTSIGSSIVEISCCPFEWRTG